MRLFLPTVKAIVACNLKYLPSRSTNHNLSESSRPSALLPETPSKTLSILRLALVSIMAALLSKNGVIAIIPAIALSKVHSILHNHNRQSLRKSTSDQRSLTAVPLTYIALDHFQCRCRRFIAAYLNGKGHGFWLWSSCI